MSSRIRIAALSAAFVVFAVCAAVAQTSTFTYQGQLVDGALAASGTYNMQFSLWTAVSGGSQIGSTITDTGVTATNGVFTVNLDFGSNAFPGAARWLEIAVKKPADGSYTALTPRQSVTTSPYSIRTLSSAEADALSSACVGCVTDAKINTVAGSKVTGTVALANGGTGASTAANARTNLGLGTVATLSTTGSTTTFLRGDGTFATPSASGGATVELIATKSAAQTIATGGAAVVPDDVTFESVSVSPTVGAYTGNLNYTVGVTGNYLIQASAVQTSGSTTTVAPQIVVNGTTIVYGAGMQNTNLTSGTLGRGSVSAVVRLVAGDVVKIKVANTNTGAGVPLSTDGTTRISIVKF